MRNSPPCFQAAGFLPFSFAPCPASRRHTLTVGSYLSAKAEGFSANQEHVWGSFEIHDHTCAKIHLSRVNFKPGDEYLFDPPLNSFTYEPDYVPTPADFALMARFLPPGMAAAYTGTPRSSASPAKTDVLGFLSARTHLQQAFDRRANTLPNEKLPDPTQDDSFQKLKSNQPLLDLPPIPPQTPTHPPLL